MLTTRFLISTTPQQNLGLPGVENKEIPKHNRQSEEHDQEPRVSEWKVMLSPSFSLFSFRAHNAKMRKKISLLRPDSDDDDVVFLDDSIDMEF